MTISGALPIWASLLLCAACIACACGIVALAGSKKYAKRVPNALKIALAFVASQAAAMYFLPLMRAINFFPGILSGSAGTMAGYLGEALGVVWSVPCGITVGFALMPKNRAGTLFGLFASILIVGFAALFLASEAADGHTLTVLFYALSIAFGILAFGLALARRKRKR